MWPKTCRSLFIDLSQQQKQAQMKRKKSLSCSVIVAVKSPRGHLVQWFSNFFGLRQAHLEVFDCTAPYLKLLHQTCSSAFTLLVKNFVQNIATLNELCKTEKFRSHFNVNADQCKVSCHC